MIQLALLEAGGGWGDIFNYILGEKAATGAFQCTKLPCDLMNGQPLMLWGGFKITSARQHIGSSSFSSIISSQLPLV